MQCLKSYKPEFAVEQFIKEATDIFDFCFIFKLTVISGTENPISSVSTWNLGGNINITNCLLKELWSKWNADTLRIVEHTFSLFFIFCF